MAITKYPIRTKNKYGAIRTEVLGEKFDSKLEASFYVPILNLCKKLGLSLKRQVKYELYRIGNKPYFYRGDFTIYGQNKEMVIDAKGFLNSTSKHKIEIVKDRYKHPFYVGDSIVMCVHEIKRYFAEKVIA